MTLVVFDKTTNRKLTLYDVNRISDSNDYFISVYFSNSPKVIQLSKKDNEARVLLW